jgi:cold shock protein
MKQSTKPKQFWRTGVVHWFDKSSGEGLIKSDEGTNYYVHYSAIDSKAKWKNLKDKQKVKFQTVEDTTFTQVTLVKEV